MTPARRLAGAGALLVAAGVLIAGCSASSRPSTPASDASSPTPATSGPAASVTPSTVAPTTSSAAPTTSSASTPAAPTSRASSSPSASSSASASPVPARSTCTKLTVRVLLGSGGFGYEFAALQFVNDSSSACTLVGVPTVTLLRNGTRTGTVSQPTSSTALFSTYRLAPGGVAESRLKDYSDCNAPLSDTIRVVAPGSSITAARPGQLRACRLVVSPLGVPE